ncbi:MAG TPA: CaiB/BaiF CoA-transferase family protein [candidate division Zixibacteria bacterium]|nr:CaiB/BaiF CoA-transferase family protein [candidate division Zixibacteria bacterium]
MDATANLPLAGVRVLDCSRVLAGPFASMTLGDLGAEVIKVEPPDGDETRSWGPPYWGEPSDGLSAYFAAINRNKRAIAVDLKTDDGRAILNALAARADILVHNFRPSTAERLGLGPERLATDHPHLVTAVVEGFPGGAAERERPAYDLLAQAVSGYMWVTGEPDGQPTKVGVAVLDLLAGLQVALGAVAALVGRDHTPVARVQASLVEVGVTSLINVLANHVAGGDEPQRHGSGHPNIVPYQSFEAADGHLVIAIGNNAQFGRLLEVLGVRDPDGRYATNALRLEHRDEVIASLADAIRVWKRDDLLRSLAEADIPAGPVNRVSEAVRMMEDAHGGSWLQEGGPMRLAPSPLLVDGRRAPLRRPPPRLGEHTDEILAELGWKQPAIDRMREAGIVR